MFGRSLRSQGPFPRQSSGEGSKIRLIDDFFASGVNGIGGVLVDSNGVQLSAFSYRLEKPRVGHVWPT